MIPIWYYAHNMLSYGSIEEEAELELLQEHFQNGCIFNPNRRFISQHPDPMRACLEVVRDPSITGVVFTEFLGCLACGVYAEIRCAQKREKPVLYMRDGEIFPLIQNIILLKQDRAIRWAQLCV